MKVQQVVTGSSSSLSRKMKMILEVPLFLYYSYPGVQQKSLAIDSKKVVVVNKKDKHNYKKTTSTTAPDGAATGGEKEVALLSTKRTVSTVSIDEKADAEYLRRDKSKKEDEGARNIGRRRRY